MTGGSGGQIGTGGGGGAGGAGEAGGKSGGAGHGGAAGSGGGGGNCSPGYALSVAKNGSGTGTTGPNNDAAAARVDVDFGSNSPDLPVGKSLRTIEYWAYVLSTSWVGNANTMYFYGSTARPAHGFGLDFGTDAVNGNHATLDPYTNGGL